MALDKIIDGCVYQHRKGGKYTVIGESRGVVFYVAHKDGSRWWRPIHEFQDGRFTYVGPVGLSADELGFERG